MARNSNNVGKKFNERTQDALEVLGDKFDKAVEKTQDRIPELKKVSRNLFKEIEATINELKSKGAPVEIVLDEMEEGDYKISGAFKFDAGDDYIKEYKFMIGYDQINVDWDDIRSRYLEDRSIELLKNELIDKAADFYTRKNGIKTNIKKETLVKEVKKIEHSEEENDGALSDLEFLVKEESENNNKTQKPKNEKKVINKKLKNDSKIIKEVPAKNEGRTYDPLVRLLVHKLAAAGSPELLEKRLRTLAGRLVKIADQIESMNKK